MSCEKKYYQCRKMAKQKARVLTLKEWKKFIVYKCDKCSMFHLTTKSTIKQKQFFRKQKYILQNIEEQ